MARKQGRPWGGGGVVPRCLPKVCQELCGMVTTTDAGVDLPGLKSGFYC